MSPDSADPLRDTAAFRLALFRPLLHSVFLLFMVAALAGIAFDAEADTTRRVTAFLIGAPLVGLLAVIWTPLLGPAPALYLDEYGVRHHSRIVGVLPWARIRSVECNALGIAIVRGRYVSEFENPTMLQRLGLWPRREDLISLKLSNIAAAPKEIAIAFQNIAPPTVYVSYQGR